MLFTTNVKKVKFMALCFDFFRLLINRSIAMDDTLDHERIHPMYRIRLLQTLIDKE